MNYKANELLAGLQHAVAKETKLIEKIREVCANADASWVDNADERTDRLNSLTQLSTELNDLQTTAAKLMKSWSETRGPLPTSLRQALTAKRKSLLNAIEAIHQATEQTRTSKDALLRRLTRTNQSQEMLGAYKQR